MLRSAERASSSAPRSLSASAWPTDIPSVAGGIGHARDHPLEIGHAQRAARLLEEAAGEIVDELGLGGRRGEPAQSQT